MIGGQWVSFFGDVAFGVAIAIWAKDITGSSAIASIFLALAAGGSVFAPLMSPWLARIGWRNTLILGNSALAGIVGTFALLDGTSQLVAGYFVAFCLGIGSVVVTSAQAIGVGALGARDVLAQVNSLVQGGQEAIRLAAPLAGASLYGLHGRVDRVAVLNSLTFIIASIAALRTPMPRSAEAPALGVAWATGLRRGLKIIWRLEAMRWVLIASGLALFSAGLIQPALLALSTDELHQSTRFFAVLATGQALGAIGGALVAPSVIRRLGGVSAALCGDALIGVSALGLLSLSTLGTFFVSVALGCLFCIEAIAFTTILQHSVDESSGMIVAIAAEATLGVVQPVGLGSAALALGLGSPVWVLILAASGSALVGSILGSRAWVGRAHA